MNERVCRTRSSRVNIFNRRIVFACVSGFALLSLIVFFFGAFTSRASESEPSYKYYTSIEVEEGDSLWSIADKYITDEYRNTQQYVDEVSKLNHLSDDDIIHAGEHLTIPYYSAEYQN